MLEGKVIIPFNDKQNNSKYIKKNSKFKADEKRYNELKEKGFVGEGKEIVSKNDK